MGASPPVPLIISGYDQMVTCCVRVQVCERPRTVMPLVAWPRSMLNVGPNVKNQLKTRS
jgi:hypothetical protein